MVDTNALAGVIVAKGKTQQEVAMAIGITPTTFYRKMKRKVFGTDEIENIAKYLDVPVETVIPIFFADEVTC